VEESVRTTMDGVVRENVIDDIRDLLQRLKELPCWSDDDER
jgi:hypothetical protein